MWITEVSFYINMADPTYDIRFTYSAVETNLAIVAASAPALRGLFLKWFPRFFASLRTASDKYRNGYHNSADVRKSGTGLRSIHHHNNNFALKEMKGRSEIRSNSPTTSEEEIMTYDGIMRTTEVNIVYNDMEQSDSKVKVEPGVTKMNSMRNRDEESQTKFGYNSNSTGSF
jgi:hypothetical protein